MRKFDIYLFKLFCRPADRFLYNFVVVVPASNVGICREHFTYSIVTE